MSSSESNSRIAPASNVVLQQNRLLAATVLQHFDQRELLALRQVCRMFRTVAERYIWTRYSSFAGASSVIPAQGRRGGTLYEAICIRIDEIANSGGTGRFASDQITDAQFFNHLLGPMLTINVRVNVGTHAPHGGVGNLRGNAMQLDGPSAGGKAHAKFLTGGNSVMFGSPNFTRTALSGRTVESVVFLKNPMVKAYFDHYFELMRARTTAEQTQFSRMLTAFNSGGHPVSLALAPFVEIQPWLLTQVAGADRLIIRMFLISQMQHGTDIIDGLNLMARTNPRMTIEAYVDDGQYNNTFSEYFDRRDRKTKQDYYVAGACHALMRSAPNVKVFTQTGLDGIMHDKLILAEKDVERSDGDKHTFKRSIVGSSGFSTNVMGNRNFDIMIRVDNDGLYDYMMAHHRTTVSSRGFKTKQIKNPD